MEQLDCKSFQHSIDRFIADELENDELDAFLAHASKCAECREELTIKLLITLGLQRLEDGKTFNLGDEYTRMIKSAAARLSRRRFLQRTAELSIGVVIVALLSVITFAVYILIL